MAKGWGKTDRLFLGGGSKITADGDCIHEIKDAWSLEESYDQPRLCMKMQRHYFPNKIPSSPSYGFSHSHVWMWELDCKESWAPKNWYFWTVVLEKTLESPLDSRIQKSILKEISPEYAVLNKDWCWSWNSNTLATSCKELTHWKRPWCWERLKVGGEGDDRGWDGWMASLAQWTCVWVNSGSWWWTGGPGMLQSMGSQRVRIDSATELNWTWQGPCEVLEKECWIKSLHSEERTDTDHSTSRGILEEFLAFLGSQRRLLIPGRPKARLDQPRLERFTSMSDSQ